MPHPDGMNSCLPRIKPSRGSALQPVLISARRARFRKQSLAQTTQRFSLMSRKAESCGIPLYGLFRGSLPSASYRIEPDLHSYATLDSPSFSLRCLTTVSEFILIVNRNLHIYWTSIS